MLCELNCGSIWGVSHNFISPGAPKGHNPALFIYLDLGMCCSTLIDLILVHFKLRTLSDLNFSLKVNKDCTLVKPVKSFYIYTILYFHYYYNIKFKNCPIIYLKGQNLNLTCEQPNIQWNPLITNSPPPSNQLFGG